MPLKNIWVGHYWLWLSTWISCKNTKSLCEPKRIKGCAAGGISCACQVLAKITPRVSSCREKENQKEDSNSVREVTSGWRVLQTTELLLQLGTRQRAAATTLRLLTTAEWTSVAICLQTGWGSEAEWNRDLKVDWDKLRRGKIYHRHLTDST